MADISQGIILRLLKNLIGHIFQFHFLFFQATKLRLTIQLMGIDA
jgi:hypothetical protein